MTVLLYGVGGDPLIEHRVCTGCGCTDSRACRGGCTWVDIPMTDICSNCALVESDAFEGVAQVLAMDGSSVALETADGEQFWIDTSQLRWHQTPNDRRHA